MIPIMLSTQRESIALSKYSSRTSRFEFKPFLIDMKSLNANDVATIMRILSPAEKLLH